MKSIYSSYLCKRCKKQMILITEEIKESEAYGRYLSCAYCGSKNIIKEKEIDDLRECMKHSSYKRIKGYLRQVDS